MSNRPTLQQLAAELDRLRARIEKLEDLRDRKEAIRAGFAAVERGEYTDYEATSIKTLARRVKSRARRRLAAERVGSVR